MSIQNKLISYGGIHNVVLVDVNDITNDDEENFTYSQGLKIGLIDFSGRYTEKYQQGSYQLDFSCIIAQNRPSVRAWLLANHDTRLVLAFGDMNGYWYKAGSVDYPFELVSFDVDFRQEFLQRNETDIRFRCVSDVPAYFLGDADTSFQYATQVYRNNSIPLVANTPYIVTHGLGVETFCIEVFTLAGERIANLRTVVLNQNQIELTSLIDASVKIIIIA